MGSKLELLKKLKTVEFDWDNKHTGKVFHDIGFIAEEVEKVFPEAVFYNEKGQVEGLKIIPFIALLVDAIKELGG